MPGERRSAYDLRPVRLWGGHCRALAWGETPLGAPAGQHRDCRRSGAGALPANPAARPGRGFWNVGAEPSGTPASLETPQSPPPIGCLAEPELAPYCSGIAPVLDRRVSLRYPLGSSWVFIEMQVALLAAPEHPTCTSAGGR